MSIQRFIFLIALMGSSVLHSEILIENFEITQSYYDYRAPTERFLAEHNKDFVFKGLRSNGMTLQHRNFFEHLVSQEEMGFFGYHSTRQEFRIYQDVIRMILEELCGFFIKKNFYFFRIPQDPSLVFEKLDDFFLRYPQISDMSEEQQAQLLSLNYALFGNYNAFGSCSVAYFTFGKSASTVLFEKKLEVLFDFLGIPKSAISSLFAIGKPLTEESNAVIYQFFDMSHYRPNCKPYALSDKICYHAVAGGNRASRDPVSLTYLRSTPKGLGNQLRLFLHTNDALNPYSPLYIRRYERNDEKIVSLYEKALREAVKNLPYNKEQALIYKVSLEKAWNIQ